MTLLEAINERHSVRRYRQAPLGNDAVEALQQKIAESVAESGLNIQLVLNEPKGFSGMFAYGKFSGVTNYIVIAYDKSEDADEKIGYYGEQIVLLAQQLGLGTCWAGLSYRKVEGAFSLKPGQKVSCMIAVGHPADTGHAPKRKSPAEVSNASADTPEWFVRGVEAALKAPTAINQQKFRFEYCGERSGRGQVRAKRLFSMVGYTKIDLGIAKLHFEIAAGADSFEWI